MRPLEVGDFADPHHSENCKFDEVPEIEIVSDIEKPMKLILREMDGLFVRASDRLYTLEWILLNELPPFGFVESRPKHSEFDVHRNWRNFLRSSLPEEFNMMGR